MERTITADTQLTSHEVGKMLQSNPSSINKWVKEGRIAAFRTPGGHRRMFAKDVVAFLKAHTMPIPHELHGIKVVEAVEEKLTEPKSEPQPTPKKPKKKPKKKKAGARR